MKAVVFVALAVATAAMPDYQGLFNSWKTKNGRTYSASEEATRLENFKANHREVTRLNALGGAKYVMNKYSDWSAAELKRLRGTRVPAELKSMMKPAALLSTVNQSSSIDWRRQGYVSRIQDQGQCGSCWAFSATSNIESVFAIAHKKSPPPKLAEQFLVDCEHECGTYRAESGCDAGCNGGLQPNAFKYVISKGQPAETAYPYKAVDGTCQSNHASDVKITNWEFVNEDEAQIASFLATKGPVSIAADAESWSFYSSGIMSRSVCPSNTGFGDLDHGINIVGYGTTNGAEYWIIRNSWGTDWGEAGYALVPRGVKFCGLQLFATSAIA